MKGNWPRRHIERQELMRCADDNVSAREFRQGQDQIVGMLIIARIEGGVCRSSKIATELNEKSLAKLRIRATTREVNSGLSWVARRTLAVLLAAVAPAIQEEVRKRSKTFRTSSGRGSPARRS